MNSICSLLLSPTNILLVFFVVSCASATKLTYEVTLSKPPPTTTQKKGESSVRLEYVPLGVYFGDILHNQSSNPNQNPPKPPGTSVRSLPYVYVFLVEVVNAETKPIAFGAKHFTLKYKGTSQHAYTAETYHRLFPKSLYWSPQEDELFLGDRLVEVPPSQSNIVPLFFPVVPVHVGSFDIEINIPNMSMQTYKFVNQAKRSK